MENYLKTKGKELKLTTLGFTLIELLAVIVILAIIALIATPIILNMINDAKKSAAKDSAYGYIEAVEYTNSMSMLDSKKYEKIEDGTDIEATSILNKIKLKGTKPDSGTITITNGKVTSADLCINNYKIIYDGKSAKVNGSCSDTIYIKYKAGTEIYYNPVTGKMCEDYILENSKTEVTTGCLKWYIFNDNKNSSVVNMILDHNTTALVAYNSSGTNTEMKEAKESLESDTKNWKQTARLISADEVAEITGAKKALEWTSDKMYAKIPVKGESISWIYLDGLYGTDTLWHTQIVKSTGTSKYSWLFDNLYECIIYGCNMSDDNKYEILEKTVYIHGYWTSTPLVGDSSRVWNVHRYGRLNFDNVADDHGTGVRPVITISKFLIS